MNIKDIFPTLGEGRQSYPRGLSWTKKGPGRRHNHLTAAHQKLKTASGFDVRYTGV